MSNEKVIKMFLDKRAGHTPTREIYQYNPNLRYKGQTLKSNGLELINYNTQIAFHQNDKLYINVRKYSSTTSHIQSKLKKLASDMGFEIVEYLGEV